MYPYITWYVIWSYGHSWSENYRRNLMNEAFIVVTGNIVADNECTRY